MTQHSCGYKLRGRTCRPTAWAPRPAPREFTPPGLLSWRRHRRRPGDRAPRRPQGPGPPPVSPGGAETSRCQRAGGRSPGGHTPVWAARFTLKARWPHTLGRARQGPTPPLPRITCRTQQRGRAEAGTALGGRWAGPGGCGLAGPPTLKSETSSGPTPGLCSGLLPDSDPPGVLPVSDPMLGGSPATPPLQLSGLQHCGSRCRGRLPSWACWPLPSLLAGGLPPSLPSSYHQAPESSVKPPKPSCPSATSNTGPHGSRLSPQPTGWSSAWQEGLKEFPARPRPQGRNLRGGPSPRG